MYDDYELLEKLGSGTLGTTHRAQCLKDDLSVIVKIVENNRLEELSSADWARFRELPDFTAQHPEFVRVLEVDPVRGWIVSEPMTAALLTDQASSPRLVTDLLRTALQGLEHLHRQGRLHGAIHPRNLLRGPDGRLHLGDPRCLPFGNAGYGFPTWAQLHESSDLEKPSSQSRTSRQPARYQAPELLDERFGQFGPALDLYSLGVTACEWLVGKKISRLFPGTGSQAINPTDAWLRWHAQIKQPWPSLNTLRQDLPPALAELIDQMLKKPIDQRLGSATQALEMLVELPDERVVVQARVSKRAKDTSSTPFSSSVGTNGGTRPMNSPVNDLPTSSPVGRKLPTTERIEAPPDWMAQGCEVAVNSLWWLRKNPKPVAAAGLVLGFLMLLPFAGRGAGQAYPATITLEPEDARLTVVKLEADGSEAGTIFQDSRTTGGKWAQKLPPGKYKASASAALHDKRLLTFDVSPERTNHVAMKLDRKLRMVEFANIEPPEALETLKVITPQGKEIDPRDLQLPMGQASTVTVKAQGFKELSVQVKVDNTDHADPFKHRGVIKLDPRLTRLTVKISPEGANAVCRLNDEELKGLSTALKAGEYTLKVTAPGMVDATKSFKVSGLEKNQEVQIDLEQVLKDIQRRVVRFQAQIPGYFEVRRGSNPQAVEHVRTGESLNLPVGETVQERFIHHGVYPDPEPAQPCVIEAGAGDMVVQAPTRLKTIRIHSLGLELVTMDPDGVNHPVSVALSPEVFSMRYPKPADRSGSTANTTVDPELANRIARGSGDLACLEEALYGDWAYRLVFERKLQKTLEKDANRRRAVIGVGFAESVKPQASFVSSGPITWSTYGKVMGREFLPSEVLKKPNDHADKPVVGLTATQAEAFCRTLTSRISDELALSRSVEVTLPSHAEMLFLEHGGIDASSVSRHNTADEDGRQSVLDQIRTTEKNIAAYKAGLSKYRSQQTVFTATPNRLGVRLGLVSSWTRDTTKNGTRITSGPDLSLHSERIHHAALPWTPTRKTSDPTFSLEDPNGYWPGLNRKEVSANSKDDRTGIYIILRPINPPLQAAGTSSGPVLSRAER